jgi:mannose-6-phosphate isomerase-like protein (cupin superfamily)
MKIIHKNETKILKNSEVCTAVEYPMDDKDMNGAVIELGGRYPDKGRTMNEKCKEMAYVIRGSGRVVVEDKEIQLNEGDLVLIESGERFFWEGKMTLFMSCTPAWSPDQYRKVE